MFFLKTLFKLSRSDNVFSKVNNCHDLQSIKWSGPETVSLDDIEFISPDYDMSNYKTLRNHQINRIIKSMKMIGLTCPPHLIKKPDGRYFVLSGLARLISCNACNIAKIKAFFVNVNDTEPEQLLLFWLSENRTHRSLSIYEKSCVIDLFTLVGYDFALIGKCFSDYLEIPGYDRGIIAHHKLLQLSRKAYRSLAQEFISEKQALQIAQLPRSARKVVLEFLLTARFNSNEFLKILNLCMDIQFREKVSLRSILNGEQISNILYDNTLSNRDKRMHIMTALIMRRYPKLSEHGQQFANLIRISKIPPSLKIQAPFHFEGDELNITFSIKNPTSYNSIIQKLVQLKDDGTIDRLLEFL